MDTADQAGQRFTLENIARFFSAGSGDLQEGGPEWLDMSPQVYHHTDFVHILE